MIVMPSKGERLTAEQIGLLKAWIDQGAVWPDEQKHWAFTQPRAPGIAGRQKQALAAQRD